MNRIWDFIKAEDGLELSEYAVAGGIIVIATILAIQALAGGITNAFNAIAGYLP